MCSRAHNRSTAASSSTTRTSYSASKRSKSNGRTCQPLRGLGSTKPSRSSRASPSRTGVRLTPSRNASSASVKRSPGSRRKSNSSSLMRW